MCEIKPKHTKIYRLEVFTSNPYMTRDEFIKLITPKILGVEIYLNADSRFRFHIHENEYD